ncbi:MAG: Bacterial rane flanked domain family [Oscillospiraceae bacterium]|nr:Bacterial rane flanked domain family [Oscillospiraceae bacterium]
MDYQKLDKKIIRSWRIGKLIRLIILAIIFGTPTLILSLYDFFKPAAPYVYLGVGLLLFYAFITFIFYPIIEYRQWGYLITQDRVEIKHGIFFIQTSVIPILRIQHITISQGPINRKLGLSSVEIHTTSSDFTIEGLQDEQAQYVAEVLKSRLYIRLEKNNNEG